MRFSNGLELAARTESVELKPSTPGEATRDLWSQCECLCVLHSFLPFSWGYVTLPLLLVFVSCQSQLSLFCIIFLLARSLPLKFFPVRSQIICGSFQNSKFFMHLMDPREPVHRSKKTRIQLRRSLRRPQIESPQVTNLKVNPLKKTFKTDRVWSLEVEFGTPETNFVSIISNWKCKSHDHMSCIFPLVECHARAACVCVRSLQLLSIRIHGIQGKATHRSHFEPVSSKGWFCSWKTWSFFTEDLSKQKSSRFQSCLRLKYEFLSEEIPRSCGLMLCWLGMKPIIMSSRVGICRTVDPMMDVAIEGRLSTVPCQEKGRTWLQAEQVKWISNYHDVSMLSMLQTSLNKSSVPPNLRNTVVLPCSWANWHCWLQAPTCLFLGFAATMPTLGRERCWTAEAVGYYYIEVGIDQVSPSSCHRDQTIVPSFSPTL